MTPADLEALGLRVKPLKWHEREADTRWAAEDYQVVRGIWGYQATWFRSEVGFADTSEAAIATANAHHAAQVAAMIERIE